MDNRPETVRKICYFCGKDTRHTVTMKKEIFENPSNYTQTVTVWTKWYMCQNCRVTTKE